MQHNETDSPKLWVKYAKADLALASIPLPPGVMYSQLCFHAQQAAEKALKAVLIYLEIDFPNTHSIQKLIELLPDGLQAQEVVSQAVILTPYAVQARYPGDVEEVSESEYNEAISIAADVVRLAENIARGTEKP